VNILYINEYATDILGECIVLKMLTNYRLNNILTWLDFNRESSDLTKTCLLLLPHFFLDFLVSLEAQMKHFDFIQHICASFEPCTDMVTVMSQISAMADRNTQDKPN
jgi:hypothetical protein